MRGSILGVLLMILFPEAFISVIAEMSLFLLYQGLHVYSGYGDSRVSAVQNNDTRYGIVSFLFFYFLV